MKTQKLSPYLLWIGLSFLAGAVGFYFSYDGVMSWYSLLFKPSWTPPNFVFGPVWTMLYIFMGVAAGLVSNSLHRKGKKYLLRLFGYHLIVNASWSYLFFGLHQPLLALLDIIILWCMVAMLGLLFYTYSKTAGYLMLIYLIWVSYALSLNAGILYLN